MDSSHTNPRAKKTRTRESAAPRVRSNPDSYCTKIAQVKVSYRSKETAPKSLSTYRATSNAPDIRPGRIRGKITLPKVTQEPRPSPREDSINAGSSRNRLPRTVSKT